MDTRRTDEQIRELYRKNAAHLDSRLFKSVLAQRLSASRAVSRPRERFKAVHIIPVVGVTVLVLAALGLGIDALADFVRQSGTAVVVTGGTMSPSGSTGSSTPANDNAGPSATMVTDVVDSADLDPGVLAITVPLTGAWKEPSSLYGLYGAADADEPVALGPQDVSGEARDTFLGQNQNAIRLPDGRHILYHFTIYGHSGGILSHTLSIRMYDLDSGEDILFASGARSMASRADGMLAYSLGVEPYYRPSMPYLQKVMVQDGLDGTPEVWTSEAGEYTVMCWLKDSLLVWREYEDQMGELIVLSGPDQITTVLPMSELFLASSPDGERILVVRSAGTGEPAIRMIDSQTGAEVAQLPLADLRDPTTGEAVTFISGAAWKGDRVVVSLAGFGLAVLSAADGTLTLEEVITFNYPEFLHDVNYPEFLHDSPFLHALLSDLSLDEAASQVRFVTSEESDDGRPPEAVGRAVLTYDLTSGECRRWVPDDDALIWLVGDPS